jgi:transposase
VARVSYPPEFRRDAVAMARRGDRHLREIARSLGISRETLRGWVKADQAKAEAGASPDPAALTGAERDELRKLRREVAVLREERDILKKAVGFFARETDRR